MENQLQVIVKESGLEKSKAQVILETFQGSFEIAADWEKKAKEIQVTNASQTALMELAGEGRKVLNQINIDIEHTRKRLKEQSLREGQTIDGVAKALKSVVIPIRDYLKEQEYFIQIQQAKKDEEILRLAHEKEEKERIATEKAELEAEEKERERIRLENETLKKEALKKEEQLKKEREATEKKQRAIEEKARKEREAAKEAKRIEQEKHEEQIEKERAKAEAERLAAEAKARKIHDENAAMTETRRKEREALEAKLAAQVECPYCHKKFVPEKKG